MKITRDNKEIEIITILEDKDNATTFHHFKGNDYKIITIAKDSDTLNDIVVYLGLYDNNPIWTREYNEFFSIPTILPLYLVLSYTESPIKSLSSTPGNS